MRMLRLLCEATTVSCSSEFRGYLSSGGLPETRFVSSLNFELSDEVLLIGRLCYRQYSSLRHWHAILCGSPQTSGLNRTRKYSQSVAVMECIGTGKYACSVTVLDCVGTGRDTYRVTVLECIGTGKVTYSVTVLECIGTGKDTYSVTVLECLYTQVTTHTA
jgi:hypothetical protein